MRRAPSITFHQFVPCHPGTAEGMSKTFGTTCHGAGRALSRAKSRRNLDYHDVLDKLQKQGISIRYVPISEHGSDRSRVEIWFLCFCTSALPPFPSLHLHLISQLQSGVTEAGHGRGARELQERHRCRGHVPRCWNLLQMYKTPADRRHQRMSLDSVR